MNNQSQNQNEQKSFALFGGALNYQEFRKLFPATRNFSKFDSFQRSDRRASHRLGFKQRVQVGEYFYTHSLLPDICFPTAKQATERAYEIYIAQFESEVSERDLCQACADGEHGECFYGFNWNEQQCLCGCQFPKLAEVESEVSERKLESEFHNIETRSTF